MKEYHIEFQTKGFRGADNGAIKATTCSLGSVIVTDRAAKMNVSLALDPLYPILEQYVLNNPTSKR